MDVVQFFSLSLSLSYFKRLPAFDHRYTMQTTPGLGSMRESKYATMLRTDSRQLMYYVCCTCPSLNLPCVLRIVLQRSETRAHPGHVYSKRCNTSGVVTCSLMLNKINDTCAYLVQYECCTNKAESTRGQPKPKTGC